MTRAHEAVLEGHVPDRQSLEQGVVHCVGLFGFSHAMAAIAMPTGAIQLAAYMNTVLSPGLL